MPFEKIFTRTEMKLRPEVTKDPRWGLYYRQMDSDDPELFCNTNDMYRIAWDSNGYWAVEAAPNAYIAPWLNEYLLT